MAQYSVATFTSALNWRWVIFTLLVFSGLIKLGLWQSDRAVEKELRLSKISSLMGNESRPLNDLLEKLEGEQELNDQPVLLTGYFDPDVLILHDNQSNKGRLGYRVYQLFTHHPSELSATSQHGNKVNLMVNLGWIQGSKLRTEMPDISPLVGNYTLKGNIRFIEQGVVLAEQVFDKNKFPLRAQQIEIDKLSQLIEKELLPFAVYLDKNESVGYEKNWQPVVMPPAKHRGYAFQWFSLAIAWLTLMICAALKNNNNNKAM